MSRAIMILVMLGVVLAMVVPGVSQEKPADNMQFVLEKVRADMKLFVAENMQLKEAEAKAFWPVYERYQDELFLLRARLYEPAVHVQLYPSKSHQRVCGRGPSEHLPGKIPVCVLRVSTLKGIDTPYC